MPEYGSFHEYIRENRFRQNNSLDQILNFIDSRTGTAASGLLIIHPPYPESRRPEKEVITTFREVHQKANATGFGCGKTDLLTLAEQALKAQGKYNVILFPSNRELVSNGVHFYEDLFLDKLYELDATLFRSLRLRFAETIDRIGIRLNQAALLINAAIIPLAAVLTYLLSLLGFDALKFFVDPQNQTVLVNLGTWFEQNQLFLYLVGVLALVVWVLYAWAALRKSDVYKIWKELEEEKKAIDRTIEIKEGLAQDQDRILKRFAGKRRPLVLLIDDVDVFDSNSVAKLIALFQKAKKSDKYKVLLLIGYNPWNPTLYYKDRRTLLQEFAPGSIRENGWDRLELQVPALTDVRTWLWGYYQHQAAPDLLETLEQEYIEIGENPSLALAFFVRYDKERLTSKEAIIDIEAAEIKLAFEQFLNRDRRMARDVIQEINKQEGGEGAIEMLKYILAYKKPHVRVDHIKTVMLTTEFKEYDLYEKILLSDELSLLQKEFAKRGAIYAFRQPYLRSVLSIGWESWRSDSSRYCTELFVNLHRFFKRDRDEPELALEAVPSQLAVDVLKRYGDYLFKYRGSSTAGFALKYYGLARGGALGKWFELCRDAVHSGDNLWELIYWKGDAQRLNPKRGWSNEADSPWVFTPELVLTAGKLYWLIGDWETARFIWEERWPELFAELQQQPVSDPSLVQKVNRINVEVQLMLAEMLYEVGGPRHWEQAREICLGLAGRDLSENYLYLGPDLILAFVSYYRQVGIGNYLHPYHFLRLRSLPIDNIEKAVSQTAMENPNRLRAYYVIADSLLQVLWSPIKPLPTKLDFSKPLQFAPDQNLWERFTQIHKEQLRNLEALIGYRGAQRHNSLPGGRVQDGDLLYWEAQLWFMSARYFCLEAIHWFKKWPIVTELTSRNMTSRFRSYCSVADKLRTWCNLALPDKKPSAAFASKMEQLHALIDKWPSRQDDERLHLKQGSPLRDMVEEQKKSELRRMQLKAKEIVEELYQVGLSSIVDEGMNRLRLAESIYRQVGYQQGIASTHHARALIAYQFARSSGKDKQPEWLDELQHYLRLNDGEVGFHLETFMSHILIGQWAREHDLYLGVQSYLAADAWALPENLGLPQAYTGEINYQIGEMIGNMDASPFSFEAMLDVLEKAVNNFSSLHPPLEYVGYDYLLERTISIHWWLAELYRRQAFIELDPDEKDRLFEKVEEEIEYVLIRSGAA